MKLSDVPHIFQISPTHGLSMHLSVKDLWFNASCCLPYHVFISQERVVAGSYKAVICHKGRDVVFATMSCTSGWRNTMMVIIGLRAACTGASLMCSGLIFSFSHCQGRPCKSQLLFHHVCFLREREREGGNTNQGRGQDLLPPPPLNMWPIKLSWLMGRAQSASENTLLDACGGRGLARRRHPDLEDTDFTWTFRRTWNTSLMSCKMASLM